MASVSTQITRVRWSGSRVPALGAICALVDAVTHGWWAVRGVPEFVRVESVVVGGWLVVGVAAAAAAVCVGIGAGLVSRWPPAARWSWCALGWCCSAALAAYGLLVWPSLAQLLMVPFGETLRRDDYAALGLRALGTTTAVLTALSTRDVVRDLRSGCPGCGRIHGRSPESRSERTSRAGFAGGYLAVVGLVVRLVPAVLGVDGGSADDPGGYGFGIFVGLMILAGTLLPLALVHRWGRIWPAWVPGAAGRPVPRWLVLGPGIGMSLGLLAYFGVGGLTATVLGRTSGEPLEAVEIGAYVLWGLGLAVASTSYARLTRPPCTRGAGRLQRSTRSGTRRGTGRGTRPSARPG